MYAITPLGVAFPRHADDVAAAVRRRAALDVPVVPPRRRHQPGRPDGRAGALVLDMSRHMHAIARVDPTPARRGSDPASCRTTSTAAAAPHGLMFGPDTSTVNRATIGGMVGNNSAGSGSMRYGMTIDHVRAARRRALRRLPRHARSREPSAPASGPRRRLRDDRLRDARRARSPTGYPPHWRRAGGYRLDRLGRTTVRPGQVRGRRRRARWSSPPRRWSAWCRAAAARVFAVGHFDVGRRRDRRDRRRARAATRRRSR